MNSTDLLSHLSPPPHTPLTPSAPTPLTPRGLQNLDGDPKHYFMAYMGTLKMGILPVALFASGHTFFTQRMYEKLGLQVWGRRMRVGWGLPRKQNKKGGA
jgi:hypothetical protein